MKFGKKIVLLFKMKPLAFFIHMVVICFWNFMYMFSGICLQWLFDVFGDKNSVAHNLYFFVGLLVCVYIGRGLVAFGVSGMERYTGFSIDINLKKNMLERIFKAHGAKYAKQANGEILNIFKNDIYEIDYFLLCVSEVVALIIYLCGILVVSFRSNPIMLGVILGISVLTVVLARAGFRWLAVYRKKVRERDGAVTGFIGEVLNSILAVKMAGTRKTILKHFVKAGEARADVSVRESVLRQLVYSINDFCFQIGQGLILLISFQMIRDGSFSVGNFVMFTFLIEGITTTIRGISEVVSKIPAIKVSMSRMEDLVTEYEEVPEVEEITKQDMKQNSVLKKQEPIEDIYRKGKRIQSKFLREETSYTDMLPRAELRTLEVQNLCCKGDNGQRLLDNVNLTIERGSITVIAGKTAAGKTMLARTLLGLYPMSAGEILWNGQKVLEPKEYFVPSIAAYTPQKPNFFSDSIRNNILMTGQSDIELEQILYQSVLEEDVKTFENGVDTRLGSQGTKVSGGQRKRIALARMYAEDAQLYVIDDAASALDVETEIKLWKRVQEQKDKTFLIVSNSKHALEIADQVVFLEDGKVQAKGKLAEVMEQSKDINKLFWE